LTRDAFLAWLESLLQQGGAAVLRYLVEPDGPEDLEVHPPGAAAPVRLRIFRTGQN
jgi:hypothetical protein